MSDSSNSVLDLHGASWRDWIIDNLQRNCAPHDMLVRMIDGVWQYEQAAAALDEALAQLGRPSDWRRPLPAIPDMDQIDIGGRQIRVLGRFAKPRAVLLDGLLSQEECQELIAYAYGKGLKHSGVVDNDTGVSITHQDRSSTSVFLHRAETPLIDALEQRLALLTGWPVTHGEGLQVLRYEPGQQYKPHFDWFDAAKPGSATHLQRGGQRVATTVMYLANAEAGGGTSFPKTGIEVSPRAGGAIFFADVDPAGRPDQLSLHAGTPVLQGTKIVVTYWQRESPFQATAPTNASS